MGRILVVDDKELMRDSVATTLVRKGHTVSAVPGGQAALEKLTQRAFDTVVTDLQMPEMDGIRLLEAVRKIDDQIPVVLMTAYGTIETAVQALKRGAFDYILKPFNGDVLQVTVEKALDHARLVRENQILKAAAAPAGDAGPRRHAMIGDSASMTQFRARLERIADSHGTVLISGESGSGKEVAAGMVHALSPRQDAPMLAINCAALSTNLLESELFGHEKGAFTGADKLRKGRFELADGGTLLLDEISEIAPEIQAKLLLQERTFERVGSSTSRSVDVRVIATTNRDLAAEVQRHRFRQDLFFRLNVLPMVMPPLREHREDVPDLVAHFLEQVATREGKPVKRADPEALDLLGRYDWPGNVRELQNICERAAVLASGAVIGPGLIEPWLRGRAGVAVVPAPGTPREAPASMIEARDAPAMVVDPQSLICDGTTRLEDIERETIVATLKHNNGHRQRSAAALGIGVRTLGLKLKKWKEMHLVADSL
ncbi:MAG: sigma-54-dependent transcriptional regulator [Planctomycetota bacterium]|jgi:DNA-binding NtrC family response regulator